MLFPAKHRVGNERHGYHRHRNPSQQGKSTATSRDSQPQLKPQKKKITPKKTNKERTFWRVFLLSLTGLILGPEPIGIQSVPAQIKETTARSGVVGRLEPVMDALTASVPVWVSHFSLHFHGSRPASNSFVVYFASPQIKKSRSPPWAIDQASSDPVSSSWDPRGKPRFGRLPIATLPGEPFWRRGRRSFGCW